VGTKEEKKMNSYFLDTFALVEIAKGNKAYMKIFLKSRAATTKLNLMELYYSLLRISRAEQAEIIFRELSSYCIEIDDLVLKEACAFRFLNKKKGLSYIDCIGYILARKTGTKFLTGDKAFNGMDNVEFVS